MTRLRAVPLVALVLLASCGSLGGPAPGAAAAGGAAAGGVAWLPSVGEAMAKAGSEGLPVFIYANKEGCGWCERLEEDSLSSPAVLDLLAGCVCAKVDPEADPEAAAFLEPLGLEAYPTMYVLSAEGEVVEALEGFLPARALDDRLKAALRSD